MRIYSRLKRLERKSSSDDKDLVIFTLDYYEDAQERKMTQQHLIDDYLSKGNKAASCYVFVNEV